jgi:hypothetical protein
LLEFRQLVELNDVIAVQLHHAVFQAQAPPEVANVLRPTNGAAGESLNSHRIVQLWTRALAKA